MDVWLSWVWTNKVSIAGWTIAIIAFVLVPFRRTPAEARSWLLIFFALPWFAAVAYWLIGRPYFAKGRLERIGRLPDLAMRIPAQIGNTEAVPALSSDNRAVARLAQGVGLFPTVAGNCVEMLSDYHEAYDRIIADIDSAKSHVHIEFYIFANDAVGDRILAAIERANERGVQCRVLIDALGSYRWIRAIKRRLKRCGAEVHDILPLRRRLRSSRLDLRNHRKIVIVDGRIGYTGSQNVWDPTLHSGRANRDILLRICGPAVLQLQAVFASDWYLETLEELVDGDYFPRLTQDFEHPAQIVPTGPENPETGMDLIFTQAMYNAAEQIVITTPYFIPNGALISAIKAAVLGGVKVRLITPARSDHRLVGLAQKSYYSELLAAGVEIYLFAPDFLHAKHLRVDQEVAVVGTSNMDVRSFELNAEIDFISYDADFARDVQQLEESHLAFCKRLTFGEWNRRSLWTKVLENSARLMSDLI
nr:cardiolipin synthase [Erythrobacter ani]